MALQKDVLLKAKQKWENDIRIYKEFLNGRTRTFDGRYGAEQFIALARTRIEAIDLKLKKLI
tara:strand:- start:1365 stop:1550 length:186 start_codon:yes stop_codon:yes gene_type:complete